MIGSNSITTKKERQIDCGNGKRAFSCVECKSDVTDSENWCGGHCEWDYFFNQCSTKTFYHYDEDGDELEF